MIRMICYDIASNAARAKVHDYLEAEGFERVQYSVFIGVADPRHWRKVWTHLGKLFDQRCEATDRIFSLVIERDHFEKMLMLGDGIDQAWILQEVGVWFT